MPADENTRMGIPPIVAHEGGKRDRAYLVVLAGASVGEMYKIEVEKTVIGRGQNAQIRLLDDGISREHAQLVIQSDRVVLEDLGSTNGTYCNGLKVDRKELVDGDKILVGSTTILKFTYHDNLDEIFQKQMYESALRDGLTKAFNKRYFTDRLDVNDTYGHPAGDQVLTDLSNMISASLRAEDIFARYGGEEFAIVCRGSDAVQGQIVAERLRKAVEGNAFIYEGKRIVVTISLGLATLPDPAIADASEMIRAADAALYTSKKAGRNRVTLHQPKTG
jgi:diguanylate cyclase (GGDEF)-like protein